jgi:hypothetical protein
MIFVMTTIICSCDSKKGKIIRRDVKTYKIEEVSDEHFFQWNNMVDRVDIIQLETTKSSLIGQFSKGIIDRQDVYLMDFRHQALLNFDIHGKFKRKIGQKGKGPDDFLELRDFCVTDSIVYVLDYRKVHAYHKKTGKNLESWSFDARNGFNPINFVVFDSNHYFLWCSNPDVWDPNSGEYYRMQKMKKGKIDSEFFKYEYRLSDDPRFYPCMDRSYYMKPIDGEDMVYKLTKDSVSASFAIDFGNMSLSPEKVDLLRNSKEPNAFLKSNAFKDISDILDMEHYIYFTCSGPDARTYEAFIHKKTGEIQFGRWDYRRSPHFFFSDGNALYGWYEPHILIANKYNAEDLNSCFSVIREGLPDLDEEDNLVVVKVYLKKP